jgi:hypothetical protein
VHTSHNFQSKPLIASELPGNEEKKSRDEDRNCNHHEYQNTAIVLEGTPLHWFPDRGGIAAHSVTINGRGVWAM